MTFRFRKLLALCLLVALASTLKAQIYAGEDVTMCQSSTATLNASATGGYGTDSYSFEVYPYQPESYTGGTPVTFAGNQDDQIAGPFSIGFQFCFFNTYYDQFYIGSNGWVGFSTNTSWTTYTSQAIPSTASNVPKNCIMAPWQDWHPGSTSANGPPYVFYKTTGTAPNRKLVVYWYQCPMFSCTSSYGTFQIVLNEQSSVIENHLTQKPNCPNWGGGTATQGVHNNDGTVAFTATGRNSTAWTVSNESTRFVPSGIKWYSGGYPGGTIVGYGPELVVSPAVTTVYTAVVNLCGGQVFTDDVTVNVIPMDDASFSYSSSTLCQSGFSGVPNAAFPGGTYTASPAGLDINAADGNINLTTSTAGTYTITHLTNGPCPDTESITLTVVLSPSASFSYPANSFCTTASNPLPVFPVGSSAGTFSATPAGLVFVSTFTGEINLQATTPGVYSVTNTIAASADCPGSNYTATVEVLALPAAASVPQGETNLCENPSDVQYTTTAQPNAVSYTWSLLPASAGVISGTGLTATVNWNNQYIGEAGIQVSATNPCGDGLVSPTLTVRINPLPKETSRPGGAELACQGSVGNDYETSGSAYATSYEWVLTPANSGTIVGSGQRIIINWSATYLGPAELKVRGVNDCGTSAWSPVLNIQIVPMPGIATQPSGPSSSCSGGAAVTYSTNPVANAVSYEWNLAPANAGIITGNSTSVQIAWSPVFSGTAALKVRAVSDCGPSGWSPALQIDILPIPLPPGMPLGPAVYCSGGGSTSYHIPPLANANTYEWILTPANAGTINGNANNIQIAWSPAFTGMATLKVRGVNDCGASAWSPVLEIQVLVIPVPASKPAGQEVYCNAGGTGTYTTTPLANATSYEWVLTPPNAGNLNVSANSVNINWQAAFTGEAHLKVAGVNDCGQGVFSPPLNILISNAVLPNAGNDTVVSTEAVITLKGSVSGSLQDLQFHWEPAALLNNPDELRPLTVALQNTTNFVLTVTNVVTGCQSTDEVLVEVSGSALFAMISANPSSICTGQTSQLHAQAYGGLTGDYQYTWMLNGVVFSNQQNLVVNPQATTTYQLSVFDGISSFNSSITIEVWPLPFADAGDDISVSFNSQALLHGDASPAGTYSYHWSPDELLENPLIQNPTTLPLTESSLFMLTVTDQNGCVSQSDNMTVLVEGGELTANPVATPDTICFGESATLSALPSGGMVSGYTFGWIEGSSFISNEPTLVVSPSETTIYKLQVNDGFFTVNKEIKVTVNPLPVVTLIGENVPHNGNTILACVYDTVRIILNNANSTFLWSDGSTGKTFEIWTSGLSFDMRNIWVEVADNTTGCVTRAEAGVYFNFANCSYGISENNLLNNVIAYPNPAGNKVLLKPVHPLNGTYRLTMFGIRGELVMENSGVWSDEGIELDLHHVSEGMYLLRLISNDEISVVKLMVSKAIN
ncbi:MAG: T9SS type A sorting domain-containing protein [Lentimicrobiaceae bacterium]|nr:T9SS type A sorting domain-containing protein [Lentimicrobiaceae bacterium]